MDQAQAERLRDQLLGKLSDRAQKVAKLEEYREGNYPLPDGIAQAAGKNAADLRKTFDRLRRESRSNWCGMVVDAVDERLAVDGFRFSGEEKAADDVWKLWQANAMDAESLLVHDAALSTGQAFVTVWPSEDGPVVTAEHPSEVLVAYEAGSTRKRRAAIKRWKDEDGHLCATLYLPDQLWKWRTKRPIEGFSAQFHAGEALAWEKRQPEGDPSWPLPNPLMVVPVVEYRANPRLKPAPYGGGYAEFEGVIDIQDRMTETMFGRLMATHYSAFRQKWVTGYSIPRDPETNEAKEPWDAAVSRVWAASNKDTRFGEFSEHNLQNYLAAVDADIQHLAAITKTPPHYLLGKMANLSGDALKAAETGLISKVRRHQRFFGEAHEEVARLMVKANDPQDARAEDTSCEVIWRDTESRSEAERVDALVKLRTIGVPERALWERIPGATQAEIERWATDRASELAMQALATITTNVQQEQPPAPVSG